MQYYIPGLERVTAIQSIETSPAMFVTCVR